MTDTRTDGERQRHRTGIGVFMLLVGSAVLIITDHPDSPGTFWDTFGIILVGFGLGRIL